MTYEKSCGAVVFTRINGGTRYLLVANLEGIYGFPKGHAEPGETEAQTALREVREEINLRIQLVDGFKTTDEHEIPGKKDTVKHITYFLGYFENQEIIHQQDEISNACLVSFSEAMELFQYESSRRILREAHEYLSILGC